MVGIAVLGEHHRNHRASVQDGETPDVHCRRPPFVKYFAGIFASCPGGFPMLASARLFVLVILAVLVTAEASLAQTVVQAATNWGLLGTWKLDCGAPTSRDNGELKYVVKAGKLVHDREFGDARDSSAVMSATRKADGSLELLVNFLSLKQTRQFSFIKASDGRLRAISNRDVNTNVYTIKDGKFTAN